MVQSIVTGFAKVVTIHVPNGSIPNGVRLRTDRRQKRPPVRHACDPTNSLNRYLKREIGKLDCTETRLGSGILVLERRFVKLVGNCFYPEKSHRRLISSLSPRFHVSHKGRILEPVEKLKGGLRSRSPRPSLLYVGVGHLLEAEALKEEEMRKHQHHHPIPMVELVPEALCSVLIPV
ncbi:unnamed protein product [Lactuca saligna]|uniref:Uncharacterized protein n=1 Tax=Lactuca saligna TaxID=75948 RepID=A0AA36EQK7_LACSI|nr:unnamed protein product [Lactuca saligna]